MQCEVKVLSNIEVDNLTVNYTAKNHSFTALEDVSFSIEAGEFVSIIGSSGCGKSTLLSILEGINTPTKGEIRIDGKPINGTGTDRGVVFQHYSLFPWMTARKNIAFGIKQVKKDLSKSERLNIADKFLPTDFLKTRLNIVNISPTNARQEADKTNIEDNKIPTFYLFAKNEGEQAKIKETVKMIFDKIGDRCIVVDFSALPFTDVLFDRFIESKAKEKYFSSMPNQKSQMDLAKKSANDCINEWTRKLLTTSLFVYSAPDKPVQKSGGALLRKELKDINAIFYGAGLEEISNNDKLFAETGFKEQVALMAMGKLDVPNNYAYLRYISTKLETDGIWNTNKFWEAHPSHPVSKMKSAINSIINTSFEKISMISVSDIWNALKKPPFGLMPNTGSVFLLGFLLKEYADSNYYKRDNLNNTVSLSSNDLGELIYGVVKNLPKAQGQYIVKQTAEQKAFCSITGEIFKIASDKRNSIDDIAKNVNIYLTNNKYPMWAMKYYIENKMGDHTYCDEMVQLTDLLCEFIKPESKIDRDRSKIVDDIYSLYKRNNGLDEVYAGLLSSENLRSGMAYYIKEYKPELISVASELKIDSKEYLEMLNSKLSNDSSYLWEIGDTNNQINNLYVDLKLIFDINRVLTTKQKTYDEARKALIEKLNIIKIPYALLQELRPELVSIIDQFYQIKDNAIMDKTSASSIIANMADEFVSFFNHQYDTFCKAIDRTVKGALVEDEYEHLFDNVSSGILFDTTDKFNTTMQHELDKYRKSKKTKKMFDAWEKLTGTSSPAVWSQTSGIPVLCLFTKNILMAQRVFDALNKTAVLPNEKDIDDAIAFLQSPDMAVLKNSKLCEESFIRCFAGDYAYIIESADDLRVVISSSLGSTVYNWYANINNCKEAIRDYATKRYQAKYCSQVKDKIKKLSAHDAQKLLDELVDKNPIIGINILKD